MRLLQRYITGELLRVFVMVLIAISILLVFVGVFQQATENGLGPVEVLQILPYVIYSLLPITIPATMLLTVTVVYGRMSGDQELIAARAAGINLISLLWPALLMGASLSAGALVLTDRVIPWSIDKIQETVLLKMEKIFLDQLRSDHQFIDPQGGRAITVIDVDQKTLIKPTIRYTPKSGQTFTIQAESANIHFDISEGMATIKVVGGYIHMSDGRGAWIREEEYPFPLPLIDKQRKARHMAANEISKELLEIKQKEKERESRQTIATAMNLMTGRFEEFTRQDFLELVQSSGTDLQRTNKLKTEETILDDLFHGLHADCFPLLPDHHALNESGQKRNSRSILGNVGRQYPGQFHRRLPLVESNAELIAMSSNNKFRRSGSV